jgi:hypothetical protein
MAWIESHQTLGQHPKTYELAERLHVPMPMAVGLVHYVWWWALEFAPNGHIKRAQIPTMAAHCFWKHTPWKFWGALIGAGFVDADVDHPGDGHIHDWTDYVGRLIQRREANRERMRLARGAQKGAQNGSVHGVQNSADTVSDTRVAHVQGLPDPTLPVKSQSVSLSGPARTARPRARGDGGLRPLSVALPDEVRQRLLQPPLRPSPPAHQPTDLSKD